MKVFRYRKKEHEGYLKKWLKDRGLSTSLIKEIPSVGWIVFFEGRPVCAGFIRKLEKCSLGLVDSYVSNPKEEGAIRDSALNWLTESLTLEGPKLGFHELICHSRDANTLLRADRFGFRMMGGQWLGLNLKEEGK